MKNVKEKESLGLARCRPGQPQCPTQLSVGHVIQNSNALAKISKGVDAAILHGASSLQASETIAHFHSGLECE